MPVRPEPDIVRRTRLRGKQPEKRWDQRLPGTAAYPKPAGALTADLHDDHLWGIADALGIA